VTKHFKAVRKQYNLETEAVTSRVAEYLKADSDSKLIFYEGKLYSDMEIWQTKISWRKAEKKH
jgi:hypothetical protein